MGGWHSSLYFENIEDNKAKINSLFFLFFKEKQACQYIDQLRKQEEVIRKVVSQFVHTSVTDCLRLSNLQTAEVGNSNAGKFRTKVGMESGGDVLPSDLRIAS